jgi:hypothetical protein
MYAATRVPPSKSEPLAPVNGLRNVAFGVAAVNVSDHVVAKQPQPIYPTTWQPSNRSQFHRVQMQQQAQASVSNMMNARDIHPATNG